MSDPSIQRLTNLLVAISELAMSLTTYSLHLANPSFVVDPRPFDSSQLVAEWFKVMRMELDDLEAHICALVHYSGVSWDVLAGYYGISRQSLHRRISERADQSMEEAQRDLHARRNDFNEELEDARISTDRLKASFDKDLPEAAKTWLTRKKTPGWWHET